MNREELIAAIREELANIKVEGAESAGADTTWEQLDVDSLDLVELVQALEERYEVRIPDAELKNVRTVGDAADLVVRFIAEGASV